MLVTRLEVSSLDTHHSSRLAVTCRPSPVVWASYSLFGWSVRALTEIDSSPLAGSDSFHQELRGSAGNCPVRLLQAPSVLCLSWKQRNWSGFASPLPFVFGLSIRHILFWNHPESFPVCALESGPDLVCLHSHCFFPLCFIVLAPGEVQELEVSFCPTKQEASQTRLTFAVLKNAFEVPLFIFLLFFPRKPSGGGVLVLCCAGMYPLNPSLSSLFCSNLLWFCLAKGTRRTSQWRVLQRGQMSVWCLLESAPLLLGRWLDIPVLSSIVIKSFWQCVSMPFHFCFYLSQTPFGLENHSNKLFRFQWVSPRAEITFSPAMGHLPPHVRKDCVVSLFSPVPISFKDVCFLSLAPHFQHVCLPPLLLSLVCRRWS